MTTWVKCPICGESDMKCKSALDKPELKTIHCVNYGCPSNIPMGDLDIPMVLQTNESLVKERDDIRHDLERQITANNEISNELMSALKERDKYKRALNKISRTYKPTAVETYQEMEKIAQQALKGGSDDK